MEFRIRLKQLREEANLSQAQLAQQIGVSQSTVGMWESGRNKPSFDTLKKLAEKFHVTVGYLAGDAWEESVLCSEPKGYHCSHENRLSILMPDDSMAPELRKDDSLLLHRSPKIPNGVILAFRYKGKTLVRRVYRMPGGLLAQAADKNTPPLYIALEEEQSDIFEPLGIVMELSRLVN